LKAKSTSEVSTALAPLIAFDNLEVGPVQLEKKRLVCPYRIRSHTAESSCRLIYSYEEPVFEPSDAASRNLAGMIAAQVAVNYGLFCRRIRFRGFFDSKDRRLLADMTENTAREIYVNKILAENRFLVGLHRLSPETNGPYTQARLEFDDGVLAENVKRADGWNTAAGRYAVLSSGGKESLLSYGLLEELSRDMRLEIHPIFINESGRHWFTALNAYRYFSSSDVKTARVWTNSDRVFNWFLRNLPFIRPDYSQLRTDYYPIRLWTVAVFVFGALPLLRKRGIRYLIIGDEYDTTQKGSHRGIPHYHGLYDQSRWFDKAISRYYRDKGWGVTQQSLLRPLSELLIEKVLAERYPQLQRFQMSCHAAHMEVQKAVPCGRCEKCRRIIGMLTALKKDPTWCGFLPDQIRRNLEAINSENLHTESAGVRQLLYMLGKVDRGCPEVMKLRFDPIRSPLTDYEVPLRDNLIEILLEHADGALCLEKTIWKEFDSRAPGLTVQPSTPTEGVSNHGE
jgi:hypothetical protein